MAQSLIHDKKWSHTSDTLPDVLEYSGEFGNELVLFIPFIYWLDASGMLKDRHIKTYFGMRSFYAGVTPKTYIEKSENRAFVHVEHRPSYLPNLSEEDYLQSPYYLFPDLRKMSSNLCLPLKFSKPLLIIHNKHNIEWSDRPVNFLSLTLLDQIFRLTEGIFEVVYIRHRKHSGTGSSDGFSWDHNENVEQFDDAKILSQWKHVYDFYELYERHGHGLDINGFKNALCAKCYYFISSQGGGTYHLSYFSGSTIAILHRQGQEMKSAYEQGLFRMTSNPCPQLLICLDDSDVLASTSAMVNSRVILDRVMFSPEQAETLLELGPSYQRQIYYSREYHTKRL